MKKKRLQFLKTFGFCLFLALGSCERDEALEKTAQKNPISFDLSKKTWKELESDLSFNTSLFRLSQRKSGLASRNAMRTAMEATHGFTISEDDVTVAQMEQSTSYTMLITRPETDTTFFENLVIDIPDEGELRALLVKYTPSEAMVEGPHGTPTFIGTKEVKPIDFESGQSFQALGGDDPCEMIVIKWCDNDGAGGTGEAHVAGDGCKNEEHIWYEIITIGGCGGGGGGPGTGPGTGPGGPGGGPGNGGGPPIGTTPTVPSGPVLQEVIIPKEQQCFELKKMSSNTNIKNTFNGPNGLESKVNEPREYGNAFKREPNFDIPVPIPRNPTNPAILNMKDFIGGKYYGANHTHPDPSTTTYVPMFPAQDIKYLTMVAARYDWNGTAPRNRDYSIFVLTLTVPGGTYALKIKDWLKLNAVMNNAGKYKKMNDKIQKEFEKIGNTDMTKLTKALLKVMHDFDLGISLYEAEQNLSKWSELSLSDPSNQSSSITKTPCN